MVDNVYKREEKGKNEQVALLRSFGTEISRKDDVTGIPIAGLVNQYFPF